MSTPRILDTSALLRGPQPRVIDTSALLRGPRPQVIDTSALLQGPRPQVIDTAALLNGGVPQPHVRVLEPPPGVFRPHVSTRAGAPEPLTARKTSATPCCDDCAKAPPGAAPCARRDGETRPSPRSSLARLPWGVVPSGGHVLDLYTGDFDWRQQRCIEAAIADANMNWRVSGFDCGLPPLATDLVEDYLTPFLSYLATHSDCFIAPNVGAFGDVIDARGDFMSFFRGVVASTVGADPHSDTRMCGDGRGNRVHFTGTLEVPGVHVPTQYLSSTPCPSRARLTPRQRARLVADPAPRWIRHILRQDQIGGIVSINTAARSCYVYPCNLPMAGRTLTDRFSGYGSCVGNHFGYLLHGTTSGPATVVITVYQYSVGGSAGDLSPIDISYVPTAGTVMARGEFRVAEGHSYLIEVEVQGPIDPGYPEYPPSQHLTMTISCLP